MLIAQLKHLIRSAACDTRGETLVETLVSVLIVAACVLMLSTAIVTAANINAKAQQNLATVDEAATGAGNDDGVVKDESGVTVTFKDSNGKQPVEDIGGKSYTIIEDGQVVHTYYYFDAKAGD